MLSFFRSAEWLMVQYARYHRSRRNIATHLVGIPMIFVAIGVFMAGTGWTVAGQPVTLAWVMWAVTSLWYLGRGHLFLGMATTLVNGLLIALSHHLLQLALMAGVPGWQLGLALFVLGWVLQFVGHYFEGRKPAFVDDIVGLLVGPMFVVAELLIALGLLGGLHRAVERQAGPTCR